MARQTSGRETDIGVAILGYGVVGKGVANAIRQNAGLVHKKTGIRLRLLRVLDLLDFPESPDAGLVTHDVNDVMDDSDVTVVVETMGGLRAANEYTRMALTRRKHVVSSNKELVAEYGPELLALAEQNGVSYGFEASVGGGVPILTPMMESLAANSASEILAILNGTTNYMLTYMKENGADFDGALRDAQAKGFAEQNPSADIDGLDACRKLAILSSIAWGKFLDWRKIHTEGIANVSIEDIERARELGRSLRLIAHARDIGGGAVEAYVAPAMIDRRSPVNSANWVNNAILVHGDLVGDVMFYGQGAGMMPTSSAIVADILAVASGKYDNPRWDRDDALAVADDGGCASGFYARTETTEPEALVSAFFREFPDARLLPDAGYADSTPTGRTAGASGLRATAGSPPRTVIFTVPPCPGGVFCEKLTRVLADVPGSRSRFIARLPVE